MRPLLPVAVLLAATVVGACGGQPARGTPTSGISTQGTATQGPSSTGLSPGQPRAGYYLALGDSLAQGVQADSAGRSVDTQYGYADQLATALRRRDPGLRLVKLGCPGETTATMINGRHCPYPAGSQLAAAVRFLRIHPGQVSLITIDIGANDPGSCFTSPIVGQVPPCVAGPGPSTTANLTRIMTRLRAAAGRQVRIVGMTYYAPELAEWRDGRAGQRNARLSERATQVFNELLTQVYASFGAGMADVSGAFHSADFTSQVTVRGVGRLPRNVAAVCAWTWICAARPQGPNKHPNTAGYAVIARAFLAADLH
jgi:lysophospholipase L1-like esterase